jgi:flagellar secretion chaperone FliS
MNRGGYRQYNQVQIKTATKGKLIVMLYQGAIRFMKKAIILMEKKDMEGKGNQLIKAQDIVLELLYALDEGMVQSGNELALNLQRLYLYSYRRLVHANVTLDTEAVEEVISLMNNLLSAWEQVAVADGANSLEQPTPATSVSLSG